MAMKRISFIILLYALSIITIFAQKSIVSGRVSDTQNHSLPGATVFIDGTTTGTITDVNGHFTLNNINSGKLVLVTSYLGYETVKTVVNVESGKDVAVNFELNEGVELSEVVVNSRLQGETRALNIQKNALSITNVVDKEQLDRFPDANIGDALKRLSGINVQYDQGEARFGNIRGTAPQLNSVTINGERVPSAEAEIRSVQLDLIPSDMVQTVEFNKAVTPDMDADAIGGSINLVTKVAPYKREVYGKLGSGYNFVSCKPTLKGAVTVSDRLLNNHLGIVISASVYDNHLGSDNIEAEWDFIDENNKDASAYTTEFQNRQYFIERLRQSFSVGLDYKFGDNHTLFFQGVYNHRNDWENRYRVTFKDIEPDITSGMYIAEIRRETKFGSKDNKYARLEDQRMMNLNLGGEHVFGQLKLNWSGSYAKASEERPNERYLVYRAKDAIVGFNYSNREKPMVTYDNDKLADFSDAYSFKEMTEEYQYTDEIDKNFRVNFEIPLFDSQYASKLKFGARYKGKEKERENDFFEFEPTDEDAFDEIVFANLKDISRSNYMAGDYNLGHYVDPKISDKIILDNITDYDKSKVIAELAGNFNAKEDVMAGYVMVTQNIGSKFSFITGLRIEQTKLEYQGFNYFEEIEDQNGDLIQEEDLVISEVVKDNYSNILPSLHLKYELTKNANLRFAWTNSLARPNYYDLVPYQEINEDNEITIGNPSLKPTTSMNFDLLGEHYFSNVGFISAGVFYKKLNDVMAYLVKSDYTYKGEVYDLFTQPDNIANATLFGAEIGVSRKLTFLPSFLKQLTFYGNYTYVSSKLEDIEVKGRENEDLPLAGSPKHTYNLSLAYDTKKFDIRLSFNHASAFLNVNEDGGIGEEAFFDYYQDAVNYMDLNLDYKFAKNWNLYFNVNNILNQPLRFYQGISERTMQAEYYGMKVNFGIGFKF
ncbi:MAG: TonB-dependent receptor [Marinilabiliaceae bacterium]|nr:TonB-dependent receptor [Marinilabiliaceae bacterium]